MIGVMKTSSLEILEKTALPPAQARAILQVMEIELASTHEMLATRADLAELRLATSAELTELRLATKADLAELRAELRTEIKAIEGALSRWVLTCILGQTAVLAGLGYFLLARAGR
jgi:hypothetical protein